MSDQTNGTNKAPEATEADIQQVRHTLASGGKIGGSPAELMATAAMIRSGEIPALESGIIAEMRHIVAVIDRLGDDLEPGLQSLDLDDLTDLCRVATHLAYAAEHEAIDRWKRLNNTPEYDPRNPIRNWYMGGDERGVDHGND